MNIQDLGALGELIGSIAVVVTLIYLAIQVKQNTSTIILSESAHRATIETELNKRFHDLRRDLYTDPELARIYRVGMITPEKLDTVEWDRFYNWVYSQFLSLGEQYRLSDSLVVERGEYQDIYEDMFRYPGIRAFWKSIYAYDLQWSKHVQAIYERTQASSEEELLANPSFQLPSLPSLERSV
jgi:hypothetical protein